MATVGGSEYIHGDGRSIIGAPYRLSNARDTNYAHEIGHSLGLPHAFSGAMLQPQQSYGEGGYNMEKNLVHDPATGGYLGFSDFWDLVYKPVAGPGNDVFYHTKAAAAVDESVLVGKQIYDTPDGGLTTCNMSSSTCTLICSMNDGIFVTNNPQSVFNDSGPVPA